MDTLVFKTNRNSLSTKLYLKPTDRPTYTHVTSYHPKSQIQNIPCGQALRVKRICAEEEDFKAVLSKLKKDFQRRGYKESILEEHFAKVSNVCMVFHENDRKQLLTYNEKKGDNKIKFITKYNKGLPNIRNVFESNWHILQTNEKLAETFEDKPILAFRRNRNLRDILGGMRLENNKKNTKKPSKPGHCGPCLSQIGNICCKHITSRKSFRSARTNEEFVIKHRVNCKTKKGIYLASCVLCTQYQYVGKFETPWNDAASFLYLFSVWWSISNSKARYNSNNYLGTGITQSDGKVNFLLKLADWIAEWSKSPLLTFTGQTTNALITTLRATAALPNDLLREGYQYDLLREGYQYVLLREGYQYVLLREGYQYVLLREGYQYVLLREGYQYVLLREGYQYVLLREGYQYVLLREGYQYVLLREGYQYDLLREGYQYVLLREGYQYDLLREGYQYVLLREGYQYVLLREGYQYDLLREGYQYVLLREGYQYVLTSKFQSDPLERRYGNLRSMSGGWFLVSLTEVNNSQKILLLSSVIKEDINFWENDLFEDEEYIDSSWRNFKDEIATFASEIHESCLSVDSLEVSTTISGYIAKKINEKFRCVLCTPFLISKNNEDKIDDGYLNLLSRGGLTVPSSSLANYVAHAFSALSVTEKIIGRYQSLPTRSAAKYVLDKYLDGYNNLSCTPHSEKVECCYSMYHQHILQQQTEKQMVIYQEKKI